MPWGGGGPCCAMQCHPTRATRSWGWGRVDAFCRFPAAARMELPSNCLVEAKREQSGSCWDPCPSIPSETPLGSACLGTAGATGSPTVSPRLLPLSHPGAVAGPPVCKEPTPGDGNCGGTWGSFPPTLSPPLPYPEGCGAGPGSCASPAARGGARGEGLWQGGCSAPSGQGARRLCPGQAPRPTLPCPGTCPGLPARQGLFPAWQAARGGRQLPRPAWPCPPGGPGPREGARTGVGGGPAPIPGPFPRYDGVQRAGMRGAGVGHPTPGDVPPSEGTPGRDTTGGGDTHGPVCPGAAGALGWYGGAAWVRRGTGCEGVTGV